MAYSELMLGAGKKYKDFLYINASWGLGLSIIANGQIYQGRDGSPIELAVKRYSLRRVYQGVHIKPTTIENPGVTGACLLALNRYLEKV